MYQRLYKLFFKQAYAIDNAVNGISSSLTTKLLDRGGR